MVSSSVNLGRKEMGAIASSYGLGKVSAVEEIGGRATSVAYRLRTSKGLFLVKVDDRRGELETKREAELLSYLKKQAFPCPQPVPADDGRLWSEYDGAWVIVCRRAAGDSLSASDLTPKGLETIGEVMADFHLLGKGYKKGIDNRFGFERVADEYLALRPGLPSYFKKITRTLDEECDYLRAYLETKLPKGVIHGELFPETMIFRGEKLSGVIDVGSACRGKYVYDLACAINALCFEDDAYALERFEGLIAGYESVRTLSLAEWDAFPNELRFSAFRVAVDRLGALAEDASHGRFRISRDFQVYYDRLQILRREKEGGMEGLLMAMATGYDYRKYQKVKAGERRR